MDSSEIAAPLDGWSLVDPAFMAGQRRVLNKDELNRYFDGGVPKWPHALSPEIARRDLAVALVRELNEWRGKATGPLVKLLLGAIGEGKSTILLQVASDLAQQPEWRVLWRSDPEIGLNAAQLARLERWNGSWLLVIDDADTLRDRLFDNLKALDRDGRFDIHILACAEDIAWWARPQLWNRFSTFKRADLRGVSMEDALKVVRAWRKFPTNDLNRTAYKSEGDHAQAFFNAARQESGRQEGSFFGGLLRSRFSAPGLIEYVKEMMIRLDQRPAGTWCGETHRRGRRCWLKQNCWPGPAGARKSKGGPSPSTMASDFASYGCRQWQSGGEWQRLSCNAASIMLHAVMPSTAHEVPILIFRERPDLLLELLGDAMMASPFTYDRVEDKSNSLTHVIPIALTADLVLVFCNGDTPVLVVVVEVQREPDADKLISWPGYLGELIGRYRCPCYVVVVAEDESTAQWAGLPNPYFQPNSPFVPLVLSRVDIPVVTTPEQALHSPEVALLSLTVHGRGPRGPEVAGAVMKVVDQWKLEYKLICAALLVQLLDPEQRQALERQFRMDLTEWYRNNENEAIRQSFQRGETKGKGEGKTEGKAEGKAEAIVAVLKARGVAVPARQQEQILRCQDPATLDRWLARALSVTAAAEMFEEDARV